MPIAKLRLVCHGTKTGLSLAHNAQRQAELEGRHSQARAWERDIRGYSFRSSSDSGI